MDVSFTGEWNNKTESKILDFCRIKIKEIMQIEEPDNDLLTFIVVMVGNRKNMQEILDEIKELIDEDICRKLVIELSEEIKRINFESTKSNDVTLDDSNETSNSKTTKKISDKLIKPLSSGRETTKNKPHTTRLLRQAINTTHNNHTAKKRSIPDNTVNNNSSSDRLIVTTNNEGYTTKRSRQEQSVNHQPAFNEKNFSYNSNENLFYKMQDFARSSGFSSAEEMMAVYQQNVMSPMLNMMMSFGMPPMLPTQPHPIIAPYHNSRGGPPNFRGRGRGRGSGRHYAESSADKTVTTTTETSNAEISSVENKETLNVSANASNPIETKLNPAAAAFTPKPQGNSYGGRGYKTYPGRSAFPTRAFPSGGRFAGRGRNLTPSGRIAASGRSFNKTWVREENETNDIANKAIS